MTAEVLKEPTKIECVLETGHSLKSTESQIHQSGGTRLLVSEIQTWFLAMPNTARFGLKNKSCHNFSDFLLHENSDEIKVNY